MFLSTILLTPIFVVRCFVDRIRLRAGMGYVDYAYMPQWPWWAHLLFVPVPAVLLVVLLRKLKLMRLLRRTVTTIVVTGIAYGLLGYFDVVPSITSVWTF